MPLFEHARVSVPRDDNMIKNRNADHLACGSQTFGDRDILPARCRIAARVVMHENYRCRCFTHRVAERFAGVDER